MRKAIAIILFTLFNLGAFGVTIEQHLCCHSQQEENSADHCSDDESCCDENADCCDEIVSQVKIAKDFTSSDSKISFELNDFTFPKEIKFYAAYVTETANDLHEYNALCYFPPPNDIQILYSSFLI